MHAIKRIANYVRFAATNKVVALSAFVLVSGGILAANTVLGGSNAGAADLPRDCDPSSIVNCGTTTSSEFVTKYKENKTGDLPAIYAHYGLSSSELDRFKSTAKMGMMYKDGRIVVDGKTVATNARSLGRTNVAKATAVNIGGKTYFERANRDGFAVNAIAVHVMFDGSGQVEFVAMTSCGNPVIYDQPIYKCDMLKSEQVDRDTYKFSSAVTAKNGATLQKVVYDFGDGQTVEKTNPAEVVTHDYAKAGNYNTKVTAYFTVNGETKVVTGAECAKPVEVKPEAPKPTYECTALTARQISRNKYEFTVNTKVSGGAAVKDANFTFGDTQTANGIKPANSKLAVQHEYAKEGNYKIAATVNFTVADGVKSVACEVSIKVSPESCPIKPSVPKDSPECTPCPYNPELPKDSPACEQPKTPETPETPKELPSTGPAEILGSTVGLGSLVAAGGYYIRTKRDLMDTKFKK